MRDKAQDALDAAEHLAVSATVHTALLPFALAGRSPTEAELAEALEPLVGQDLALAIKVAKLARAVLDKAERLRGNIS